MTNTSNSDGDSGAPMTTATEHAEPSTSAATASTGPGTEPAPGPAEPARFPIVGIGASAGGLAAFEAFFSAIPHRVATGMAFVLVQHLAPNHKSILTDLIKRYTTMHVQEVEDGVTVQPDCAYIIPPNMDMALFKGKLHLLEPAAPRGLRLPIDFFFRSLASDQQERAICIVLSGTGSDGTLGARAVKGEGGLVMVETPTNAAYDGMPRSVIATGLADVILPPAEMPARLIAYLAHAFGKTPSLQAPAAKSEDTLTKICLLLRDATRHDFSQYKQSTLVRRIARRMALHQIEEQQGYVRYLQHEPSEIQALFRDLLIGVTNFFRDPEAFAALETGVIPRLFAGKRAGETVRVWICGCSSGEEAYSIAILIHEHLAALKQSTQIQIFATDVDAQAIAQARAGIYPASISADISPERLGRYFTLDQNAGTYRIQKSIRDLLVFSEQDLIRDPPFSRLDLISCRNLLIYINGALQRKLIPLFHYALNHNGVLFLGSSETIGDALTLFTPLDRKWKLYARLDPSSSGAPPSLGDLPAQPRFALESVNLTAPEPAADGTDLRALTEMTLLQHFNAVGVLTNARGEICYIHGRTGQFLEPASGTAAMNIFQMAREGLHRPLTTALQRAVTSQDVVALPGLKVKTNGDHARVDLTIRPVQTSLRGQKDRADLYLVVLELAPIALPMPAPEDAAADKDKDKDKDKDATADADAATSKARRERRIAELEDELRGKDEYLQTTLEEMETSNEELKSTNEEMQSVNEELQSTNEELETSKEELQSVNEELATVNAELQTKVADLSRANDDMNNLLAGTGVATLFVDDQLRISRFTPAMTQIIKLIPSDIGRSVGDLVSNLVGYTDFVEDVHRVLQTLVPHEQVVQAQDDTWFLMRIGPYRTLNNVIEGAVMTFVDISGRKQMEQELQTARAFAEGIVDAVREPLLVLDATGALVSANSAFYRHFQQSPKETLGKSLFELGNGQWDSPALRQLLRDLKAPGASLDDYRIEQDFPQLGRRVMQLNARRLAPVSGETGTILLAFEDLTAGPATAKDAPSKSATSASPGGKHDPSDA
ncbi:PAS domain-containing protein [Thiorhodococcus mannitoliphagus]|uniref:protein-glutamate O-methyltransferase n=1 Tax=Thiorhodococcus mannitoliphagus TaxID=329406 RepID=A0A6P1E159_9GAMM|nr:chemotaxis protein CheB [Thiorhodococcus mannitoliphagus]NEX22973.1 PAS domain-containing protein [Thiorhodococcus mannitoliphagus]